MFKPQNYNTSQLKEFLHFRHHYISVIKALMAGHWNPSGRLFIHSQMSACSYWTGTASHHAVILNWIFVKYPRVLPKYTVVRKGRGGAPEKHQQGHEGGRETELRISKILHQLWDRDILQCKELPLICSEPLVLPLGVLSPTYVGICWMLVSDGKNNSFLSHTLWWLPKKQEN